MIVFLIKIYFFLYNNDMRTIEYVYLPIIPYRGKAIFYYSLLALYYSQQNDAKIGILYGLPAYKEPK